MISNIFQNNWVDGQTGIPILFTVRNQEGTAPWSIIENVEFTNNTVTGCLGVFNLLGSDNEQPSQRCTDLTISNNLSYDNGTEPYITFNGYYNVTLNHNTNIPISGNTTTLYGEDSTGFVWLNHLNIETLYGIFGEGGLIGKPALDAWTPGYTFSKNVMVAATPGVMPVETCGGITCYPASVSTVQFVDAANDNYALLPTSPYHNAGTDGTDIGVNMAELLAAQSNATFPSVIVQGQVAFTGNVVIT